MEATAPTQKPTDTSPFLRIVSEDDGEPCALEEQVLNQALVHISDLVAGAVRRRVMRVGVPKEERLTTTQEEQAIHTAREWLELHYPSPTSVPKAVIEEAARGTVEAMEFVQGRTVA